MPITRREFLLAGAGLALTGACGRGDDPAVDTRGPASTAAPGGDAARAPFSLVVASFVHVAGIDERLTLALLNSDRSGPLPIDGPVTVAVDGAPVEAELHQDGTPLAYLLVRHRFRAAGAAEVTATYRGATGKAAVQVLDAAAARLPIPGRPMVSTPSPTPAATMGVDPICTRAPVCPLHDVSLDAALAEKRPLAVLFSTPARCQSKLCGPVLDTFLAQHEAFGSRVRFLHVEIYGSRTSQALAPTVKAYNLEAEPVLFLAGPDGVVRERLDNAFDRGEARAALERLVAP